MVIALALHGGNPSEGVAPFNPFEGGKISSSLYALTWRSPLRTSQKAATKNLRRPLLSTSLWKEILISLKLKFYSRTCIIFLKELPSSRTLLA